MDKTTKTKLYFSISFNKLSSRIKSLIQKTRDWLFVKDIIPTWPGALWGKIIIFIERIFVVIMGIGIISTAIILAIFK